jgi:hypothetical protein
LCIGLQTELRKHVREKERRTRQSIEADQINKRTSCWWQIQKRIFFKENCSCMQKMVLHFRIQMKEKEKERKRKGVADK